MTYDQIQLHLGAIGDEFASYVSQIFANATAPEETVQLVLALAREVQKSLNDLAICISQAMQLN